MPDFVMIPVPTEHVTDVYALLARLGGKQNDRAPGNGGESTWPIEDLRVLRDSPGASTRAMAQVLDLLAESPDVPVAFSTVAGELGIPRTELQGLAGGFTKWVKKRWPDEDASWPMDVEYAAAVDPGLTTETFYSMTRATADVWKQIRAE